MSGEMREIGRISIWRTEHGYGLKTPDGLMVMQGTSPKDLVVMAMGYIQDVCENPEMADFAIAAEVPQ